MHIILGALAAICTILFLLNRLAEAGIDLAGLNPFLWNRRRKWRKKYQGNPVFKIDSPMDATAILMVAVAKADGDLTKESKGQLLNLFEQEFGLSKKDAAGLLISSSHLLGDGTEVRNNVKKFLAPSKDTFTKHQISSTIGLIETVAGTPAQRHPNTAHLITKVNQAFEPELR
ncbi:MAG: TerB family tellurite resistance protein [Pseudomonadota bacterium]